MLKPSRTIRGQLLWLVLLGAVPAMLFVFYLSYVETNRELEKAQASVRNLAQLTAVSTGRALSEAKALMASVASRPAIRALDSEQCDPFLDEFANTFSFQYSGLGMINRAGQLICSGSLEPGSPPPDLTDRSWFQDVMERNQFAVSGVQTGRVSNQWVAILAYPIKGDEGRSEGALIMPLDLERYQVGLERVQLPEGAVITIVDNSGTILADSSVNTVGQDISGSDLLQPLPEASDQLFEAEGWDGIDRLYAYAPVPDAGWFVYAGIPASEVFAPVEAAVWRYAFLTVTILLLVLALVLYIRFQLERPLRQLAGVATAVAAGDTALRAQPQGPAELARVAQQFNNMLDVRHHLYQQEQQARRMAEGLRRATLALSESLNLEVVVARLLEAAADLVPYDSANVLLLAGQEELTIYALRGYAEEQEVLLRDIVFDLEKMPHLQHVLQKRRGVLLSDVQQQAGWQPIPGTEHVRSWLAVPLVFEDQLMGVLSLDSIHPGFFTRHHLHLLEALGAAAAVAIHHTRVFANLRKSQEQLRRLTHQLIHAQEEERERLSQALHDDAGQTLTALQLMLGMVRSKIPDDYSKLQGMVSEAADMVGATMEDLRHLSQDLRPPSLNRAPLPEIIQSLCQDFGHRTGLEIECHSSKIPPLPEDVPLSLYRFAQEALTNVANHADARRVEVNLSQKNNEVCLSVGDDGQGFDVAEVEERAPDSTVGLRGIHERLQLLGGRLEVQSHPGNGTRLVAYLPVTDNNGHFS